MAIKNIERKVDQVQDVFQEAPQDRRQQSSIGAANRYVQARASVNIGVIGFGAMLAISLGCVMGFIGLVTNRSLIVGGIGFTIFEVKYVSMA
ncbi:MAG: hypothetical protein JOS17DRAFT_785276 [Linnemannia elongata]|nr:MAG: hypothetical protein JOS17DRAFT_785276 [Linnemannia elongata]